MNFTYETKRLKLNFLDDSYNKEVLNFLISNREYFEKFEPPKNDSFYTEKYQKANLKAEFKGFLNNVYYRFYVFLKDDPSTIIGTISFSQIFHFPYDVATIGYKFAPEYQGFGYATEAISCATYALFRDANLHRIQAYVLPDNEKSIHLLERIGYEKEGLCRSSINVNGVYKDHYLYAIVNRRIRESI